MQVILHPQLPNELARLTNLPKVFATGEALSDFTVDSQDLSELKVKSANISEAKFIKDNLTSTDLERVGFVDVILIHCEMVATNCAFSSWLRVELSNMRCSGLKLQTTNLKDVTFDDCKLDLANFRFSKLKNVLFKDCILDEADFYNAELENVQFQNCSLSKTIFSSSKCKVVDLRSSEISEVVGVEGLGGTTIDSVQLVAISQALANNLKIRVSDD